MISGGRPKLKQRPTAKFLHDLDIFGANVVWVVSEKDAPGYELDDFPLSVYPQAWAREYAAAHWMLPTKPDQWSTTGGPDGFLGAFPGREWACLEAERRGCWGVLQIDDNFTTLSIPRGTNSSRQVVKQHGGMGLFADLLAGVTLSTNGRMVGAALQSVNHERPVVARKGFPYSLFVEQVGEGREPWFGPFEDDITHAYQYGTRSDGVTAGVATSLRYMKESKSKSGMRAVYDQTRAVQLQRIFPQSARIGIHASKSNGAGGPRVFHGMSSNAIRNPLRVTDPVLFGKVKARLEGILAEWFIAQQEANRLKVSNRVKAGARS